MDDLTDLLTVEDAAQLLRLKKQTVYALVMKRQLPFVKIGGSLRFSREQLRDYITDHTTRPLPVK